MTASWPLRRAGACRRDRRGRRRAGRRPGRPGPKGPPHPDAWDPRSEVCRLRRARAGPEVRAPGLRGLPARRGLQEAGHLRPGRAERGRREGAGAGHGATPGPRPRGGRPGPVRPVERAERLGDHRLLLLRRRAARVRGTELTPAVESTLVHELTHALQDQNFDLGKRFEDLARPTTPTAPRRRRASTPWSRAMPAGSRPSGATASRRRSARRSTRSRRRGARTSTPSRRTSPRCSRP